MYNNVHVDCIELFDCLQHPDTGEVHDLPILITKHQVVEINDPVQVTPKHLVILWDPKQSSNTSTNWMWVC